MGISSPPPAGGRSRAQRCGWGEVRCLRRALRDAAHPTPRPSGATLPLQGRVKTILPRSRDAPWHPSFASRFKKALRASLERREAERRQAHHWFPPRRRKISLPAYAARAMFAPCPALARDSRGGALAFRRPTAALRRGPYLDSAPGRASWNHRIQTGGPSPAPVQPAPGSPVTRRTVDAQNRPDARCIAALPGTAPAPPRSTLAKASFVERDF